jgi:3-oxoacyl-[acyl-carrier-protein] synthase-3
LLEHSDNENQVLDTICRLDSTNHTAVFRQAGGSHIPATEETLASGDHYMRLMSRSIGPDGVQLFKKVMLEFLHKNNMSFDDIDYIVPHQANKRMIESLAAELGLPIDKFIINIEYLGNTSAATIPLAISQALESGHLKGNEKLLLASVGAGFTYAAGLINLDLNTPK